MKLRELNEAYDDISGGNPLALTYDKPYDIGDMSHFPDYGDGTYVVVKDFNAHDGMYHVNVMDGDEVSVDASYDVDTLKSWSLSKSNSWW